MPSGDVPLKEIAVIRPKPFNLTANAGQPFRVLRVERLWFDRLSLTKRMWVLLDPWSALLTCELIRIKSGDLCLLTCSCLLTLKRLSRKMMLPQRDLDTVVTSGFVGSI